MGFSLGKILVLALVVAAIWYGFKWVARMNRLGGKAGGGRVEGPRDGPDAAEPMVNCPVCDAYVVARGAAPCGRDDCPYRG